MAELQERAMLVHLKIEQWTATRNDKRVVDEVAAKHQTNGRKIGSFSKRLIDPDVLKPLSQAINAAREDHRELTLPFDDVGYRLLPAVGYEGYCEIMRRHGAGFDRERRKFITAYPGLVNEARTQLGSLFRASEYPRHDDLERRFGFKTSFRPIPESGHFVVEVAAEQANSIDVEARQAAERAATDVWHRVHDRAKKLASGLRAYADNHTGEVQRNFRSSLVENVTHLADLFPKLNFMADPGLEQMARRLKDDLCRFEADRLKEAPDLRREVAEKADKVCDDVDQMLASMSGYV